MAAVTRTDQDAKSLRHDFRFGRLATTPLQEQVPSIAGRRLGPPETRPGTPFLAPPTPVRSQPFDWSRAGRSASYVASWIGALVLCVGMGLQSPAVLIIAAAMLSVAMAAADLGRSRQGGISVITLHSVLSAAT